MNEIERLIDIDSNPFVLFKLWYEDAKINEINNHNAMNLATVGKNLNPSSRIVLLKTYDSLGFVFFTNLNSKKGDEIHNNSKVALNFHWKSIQKQVRIEGRAKTLDKNEANSYFESRPRESRIGAWSSDQSSELSSRVELNNKVNIYKKKFKGKKIPRPKYWSGYRVVPNLIEFWQEMPFRLHDRIEFIKSKKKWKSRRLYP